MVIFYSYVKLPEGKYPWAEKNKKKRKDLGRCPDIFEVIPSSEVDELGCGP